MTDSEQNACKGILFCYAEYHFAKKPEGFLLFLKVLLFRRALVWYNRQGL